MIDLSDLNNLTFDPKLKGKMAVQLVASHGLQLHRHDFVGLVEASIDHYDPGSGIQFDTIHQDVLVYSKSCGDFSNASQTQILHDQSQSHSF